MLSGVHDRRPAKHVGAATPTTLALGDVAEGPACDEYLHSGEITHRRYETTTIDLKLP